MIYIQCRYLKWFTTVYTRAQGAGTNINMFVEAFHNTLKQVYMQGRINRRVDNCLRVLHAATG